MSLKIRSHARMSAPYSPRSKGSASVNIGKKMKNPKREFHVEDAGNGTFNLDARNLSRAERDAVLKVLTVDEVCSKTLSDQVDRKDEIEKLINRYESSQFSDVPVTNMRHIIPQLLLEVEADQFGAHVRKVKGIWSNKPADWPLGVKYVDPNNKMVEEGEEAGRKPTKEVLLPMLIHLVSKYMKKYPVRSIVNSSSGVEIPQQVEEDEDLNCLQSQLKRVRRKNQRLQDRLTDGQLASIVHCQDFIQKQLTFGSLSDDGTIRLVELAHQLEVVLDTAEMFGKLSDGTKTKLRHVEELCRNPTIEQDSKADVMMRNASGMDCGQLEAGHEKSCPEISDQGPSDERCASLNIKVKGSSGNALWMPLEELDVVLSNQSDVKEQGPWGFQKKELNKKVVSEQIGKFEKSENAAVDRTGDGDMAKQLNINVEKRPAENVDWMSLLDEVRVGEEPLWLSSVDIADQEVEDIFEKLSKRTSTVAFEQLPELDVEMVTELCGEEDVTETVLSGNKTSGTDAGAGFLQWCLPHSSTQPFKTTDIGAAPSKHPEVGGLPTQPLDLYTEMAFSPGNPLSPAGEVTGTLQTLSIQQIPASFFNRNGSRANQIQNYNCLTRIPAASCGKRTAPQIPTMVEHEDVDDDFDICLPGNHVKKVRLDR